MSGAFAPFRVRVPATSANLGPGFDTLGLALAVYDEVEFAPEREGVLDIEIEGVEAAELPRDANHLVVRAMAKVFGQAGMALPGLRMRAHNRIPHGRGLGSSGAAIVTGVVAGATMLEQLGGRALPGEELLAIATAIEGHPDNVAPCLFGGLTIAWMRADGHARSTRLLVHRGVSPTLLVPQTTMSTKVARSLQPSTVSHEDAIFNLSRSALLIAALLQSPELLFEATEDRLHQRYRSSAMPATKRMIEALRDRSLPAVVSGAGPAVLVLCPDPAQRRLVAEVADSVADDGWTVRYPAVDLLGATVEDVRSALGSPSA